MSQDTSTRADPRPRTTARAGTRQRWPVLALLAMVVLLDQSTKWWGWRHVPAAIIKSGGDMFVGPMVGGWYADPASGALLDLVSVGLLSSALFGLLRRRSPTAPGSVRGAIDFIGVGHCFYNVADLVIVGSSMLLVLWVGYRCLWVRVAAGVRSAAIPAARSVDSGPIPEEPSPRRSSDCPHRTV